MRSLNEIDWAWGGMMTVVGMGVVFALLAVLWLLLWVSGRLDQAALDRASRRAESDESSLSPADASLSGSGGSVSPANGSLGLSVGPGPAPTVSVIGADGLDDDTVAAIAVAVIKHADIRRKQAAPEMRASAPGSQLWASRWLAVGRALQNAPFRRG